ncbi:MAG: translational GTPase TypA [Thermoanaerobaculia bacterium]|nr:GTP-binding protein TypA/BipA [Thermoanaerobaculia bacterium]MCK6684085.1 translational GTPase TypA [Thermoanaerobaculia bacterium]
MSDLRNIAIIAHVDHGKTTLVDCLLKQSGTFRANEQIAERVMDSNDLERERGITILAKNLAIRYHGVKVNIIDTPGHSDFGGEVERTLNMVDAVLLLVDAAEGAMPQTRFVLRKALEMGLKPIVVVNKVDRPDARPHQVIDQVFDLMVDLGATDEQLDFPIVYTSAKHGFARREIDHADGDVRPLLDAILVEVPEPGGDPQATLQLLIASLDYDNYLGRLAIGRIVNGTLKAGQSVSVCRLDGRVEQARVTKLMAFDGLKRIEVEEASAGEIVVVAGIEGVTIGETLSSLQQPEALPPIAVDEPTVSMTFRVNDSPFAGREGKYVTSRNLAERLEKELRTNVALRVEQTDSPDALKVSGRGELHLSILAETMRREGFEFGLSRPEVIVKEIDGVSSEPVEQLTVDVPEDVMGTVIEKLGRRRAELTNMTNNGSGRVKMDFQIPTRGLFGYRSEFLTDTKGEGIMYHVFSGYEPWKGDLQGRRSGALICKEGGETTAYSLERLEERSVLFMGPGIEVYAGMICGENSRENDLIVNPCVKKHLTNMRASNSDMAIKLTPPRDMPLEAAIEWIEEDELVEVTPRSVRLRKRILDHSMRRVSEKRAALVAEEV